MSTASGEYRVRVNGVFLNCIEKGPADGPAVILLHGFPEFSYAWRHQIPPLAAAGFRVIAPDLRGYNLSDKPKGVRAYRIEELVADVAGLIEFAGGSAVLVGHDWGGIIGWFNAIRHPKLVRKLIILNAPHPAAYLRELKRPAQLLRSWYVLFFQLPWLPEAMLKLNDFALPRRLFRQGPARRGASSEDDVGHYVLALAQPGALTATINYYRAAIRFPPVVSVRNFPRIDAPTLILWGDQDAYLVSRLTEDLKPWVADLRVEHLRKASHWIQHDEPEWVTQKMLAFIRS